MTMNNRGMMVLFEGQDRCGKGTQINKLYKRLASKGIPTHIAHYSNPGIKDVKECISWSWKVYEQMFVLGAILTSSNAWFIADRAHLGEWVYGKKYRKYDADFIWNIERHLPQEWLEDNVVLIVFTDATRNLTARDDGLSHSSKPEDMDWERERFKDAFNRSAIRKKLYIDIDGKSIEQVELEIKDFLERNQP